MRITDLYESRQTTELFQPLRIRCAQFFGESNGLPLLKNLSEHYGDFHKVKVRKRNSESGEFTTTFNEAFESQHPGLRQRAVFANGIKSLETAGPGAEPFYIFPIDGYKFMYSKEVENSGHEYKQVFETLFDQFGEEKGNEVLADLLRFTYTSHNLCEGIDSGSEIIIYGIPYFYAVRTACVESYEDLLSTLRQ